jgi:hypothetical protein
MSINTTKKAFVELVSLLEKHSGKKITKELLEQIHEMTKQKASSKTFLLDTENKVVAIFCYYHKQWEILDETPYGAKASSTTGYNTMCKKGVSLWTKQNNAVKQVGEAVLNMLESGEIEANEIADTKEKLIAEAKMISNVDMPMGYELSDLCVNFGVTGEETFPKAEADKKEA